MNNLFVGASAANERGYISARCIVPSRKKLKLLIETDNEQFVYDLRRDGNPENFPLQCGNGDYYISLMEQKEGNEYTICGEDNLHISAMNPIAYALHPNQYVDYDESVYRASAIRIANGKTDEEKFRHIQEYMNRFNYDYVKAVLVRKGALPDIVSCMKKRMGICQDLAATTAMLLRLNGIPAKLSIGKVGKQNHAWVTARINDVWMVYDPTVKGKKAKEGYRELRRY